MAHPLLLLHLNFTYLKTLKIIMNTTICPNVPIVSFLRGKGSRPISHLILLSSLYIFKGYKSSFHFIGWFSFPSILNTYTHENHHIQREPSKVSTYVWMSLFKVDFQFTLVYVDLMIIVSQRELFRLLWVNSFSLRLS